MRRLFIFSSNTVLASSFSSILAPEWIIYNGEETFSDTHSFLLSGALSEALILAEKDDEVIVSLAMEKDIDQYRADIAYIIKKFKEKGIKVCLFSLFPSGEFVNGRPIYRYETEKALMRLVSLKESVPFLDFSLAALVDLAKGDEGYFLNDKEIKLTKEGKEWCASLIKEEADRLEEEFDFIM